MSTHISMRDALECDRESAREVTLAAYEEYAKIIPPLFWEGYRKNIVASLDEKGPAQHIVAENTGKIVGGGGRCAALSTSGERVWSCCYHEYNYTRDATAGSTSKTMRGHGIGTALTRECVLRAQRAGVPALGLHTMDMMQAAMRMYERMGFVRAPEFDFHLRENTGIKGYRLDLGQGYEI